MSTARFLSDVAALASSLPSHLPSPDPGHEPDDGSNDRARYSSLTYRSNHYFEGAVMVCAPIFYPGDDRVPGSSRACPYS